jgi:hypothetical protein
MTSQILELSVQAFQGAIISENPREKRNTLEWSGKVDILSREITKKKNIIAILQLENTVTERFPKLLE